jgi:hypothetical protein
VMIRLLGLIDGPMEPHSPGFSKSLRGDTRLH